MRDDARPRSSGARGRRTPRTSTTCACTPTCATSRSWSATRTDVLDREFGPELPNMRQWAREHFQFSGYTYHFDPAAYRDEGGSAAAPRLPRRRARRSSSRSGARGPGATCSASAPRRSPPSPHGSPTRGWSWWPVRGSIPASCRRSPQIEVRPFVPRSVRASRGRRSRHRAGRAHHHDGAGRLPHAVLLLPAAQSLRAAASSWRAASSGWAPACGWTTTGPPPEELGAAILDHLGQARSALATCRSAGPSAPPE